MIIKITIIIITHLLRIYINSSVLQYEHCFVLEYSQSYNLHRNSPNDDHVVIRTSSSSDAQA